MSLEARVTAGRQGFIRGFEAFTGGTGTVPTFLMWMLRAVDKILEIGETTTSPFVVIRETTSPLRSTGGPLGIGGDEDTIWASDNENLPFNDAQIYALSPISFAVLFGSPAPVSGNGGGIGGNAANIWYVNANTDAGINDGVIYELDPSDFSAVQSAAIIGTRPQDAGGDSSVVFSTGIHFDTIRYNFEKRDPADLSVLIAGGGTGANVSVSPIGGDSSRGFRRRLDGPQDFIKEFDPTTMLDVQDIQAVNNMISFGG